MQAGKGEKGKLPGPPIAREKDEQPQRYADRHQDPLQDADPARALVHEPVEVQDRLGGHQQEDQDSVPYPPAQALAQREQQGQKAIGEPVRRDQRQGLYGGQAQVGGGHGGASPSAAGPPCRAVT